MSGFISSPPAPRMRLRLSRSAGSRHIKGLPVSSFFSFLSLSFLSLLSWPVAAKGSASIRTSKQTDQNADLVRNMLNLSPACSFLVQTLWGCEIIEQIFSRGCPCYLRLIFFRD